MGQRAQSPPPPLPPQGAEPPRSVAEATLAFSPGQRLDSTTAGSAGPGPLGPRGAVGSLPGLLQLLEAPVPCGQWPPHPASDSFSGPRGSLSQGPTWGHLDLRGLHVVPPAVSSLGGWRPRLRFLGLRTGSLSWAGFCHPWGLLPVQSGSCVETTGRCLLGHPEVEGLDQLPGTFGLRPPAAPSGGPCVPGAHAPQGASGLPAGH